MVRPARFDNDQILDAAVRLAATAGPGGVSMSAVAQAIGAPSGSVYHRFSGRPALLAEVWLRTVERFQEGYFDALRSDPDPRRAARAAARHVVSWSRAHPEEASLLLYGAEEFGRSGWSEEHRERADAGNRRVFASLGELATALGAAGALDRDRVVLAVVELPLTVVRRHLRAGDTMPPYAEELAEESAAALLGIVQEP
ncbi:TetR/AcrR family transcriptional regulator [Streptomyces sp. NBC_01351]|uniref:TetR/AcrR family transcriptional regulator n=1 Tax=Streptomyces sp. NBC_01351 TaxID=2903833 RepID=UPI002E367FD4|nr:TetR/AcrR family transcriptional regulator [Streptomyces sp. NBC_01351]